MYQDCKNYGNQKACTGSVTVKMLPIPEVLSQDTEPPWRFTMAETMAKPRPLPVEEPGVLAEETV